MLVQQYVNKELKSERLTVSLYDGDHFFEKLIPFPANKSYLN